MMIALIMANEKWILRALVIILVMALLILGWNLLHPPQKVTFESQKNATTAQGAQEAANNAQIPLVHGQAAEVGVLISEAAKTPPAASVEATGETLEKVVLQEQKTAKADFSIVADAKNPNLTPVVGNGKIVPAANTEVITQNTPVILNQYNVKAYPDQLLQVGGSVNEVMIAYSWRVNVPKIPLIAPKGDVGYIGVYGHYNADVPGNSRVGIMLTIPR